MKYLIDNVIKDKVLSTIFKIVENKNHRIESPTDFYELKREMKVPDNPSKEYDLFVKNINYLGAEDYLIISDMINGTCNIKLTRKGLSACSSNYFLQKNSKIKTLFLKEIAMLFCNIIVAIAAVVAIFQSSKNEKTEIKELKARLDTIQFELSKVNTSVNSGKRIQYTTIDTLKVSLVKPATPKNNPKSNQ